MLRRIVVTAVTGLFALAGPVALASADTGPTIAVSSASVRPGAAFTATDSTGCPATGGIQDVDFTFTDSAGRTTSAGTTQTDEDGTWSTTTLQLPVTGFDDDGAWQRNPVASGAGSLVATCYASDDSGDSGDSGGSEEGDGVLTQTYAPAALTVSGSAAALNLSAAVIQPGGTVTISPAAPCPAAADVTVDVVALDEDSQTAEEATAVTDSHGAWTPVTVSLPDDAEPGDYGVTADCESGDDVLATYDGSGLAVGTVRLSAPDCGGDPVTARLTGTFADPVAGLTPLKGKARTVTAPAAVKLNGLGPWDISLTSATTGVTLLSKTLTCPAPSYELTVTRAGVSDSGRVQARVCNSGTAPAEADLQVRSGKRFGEVDSEDLDAGDCAWLSGGRVARGDSVGARVLLDAPGRSNDTVVSSFTARRHR